MLDRKDKSPKKQTKLSLEENEKFLLGLLFPWGEVLTYSQGVLATKDDDNHWNVEYIDADDVEWKHTFDFDEGESE